MSNEEKNVMMNQKLLNYKMEEKFKKSFAVVSVGFIVVMVLAMANIMIYAKAAGVGIFSTFSRGMGIVLLITAVVLNLVLLRKVSQSLTTALVYPIRQLQEAVRKLKAGQLDIDISYKSPDELGELADDLRGACVQIHTVIQDMSYVLGKMADGQFQVSSKAKKSYVGDFQSLHTSMEQLNYQMKDVLHQIQISSEQVMTGAEQLADHAQELAKSAANETEAVNELSDTIQNVIQISNESTEGATNAAADMKNAAIRAKQSQEDMNQLTEAMERISNTSKEIEKIIETIEDIASQTNLLSLNASIEAARAGEAGRGFAVVADQIGKLASDSAQSAVNTRELISKCIVEVQEGNSIVENTMESINTVLGNIELFASLASGAAETSKAQMDMLKKVETEIEQINESVEYNSATAQETSAVGEELSTQATNLEQMVAKFVLR